MSAGGRPRDPRLDERIRSSALTILAVHRLPGFTADEISAHAGIGKASLYRRWRSLDELLVDVVAGLGVDPAVVHDDWPSTNTLDNVVTLLTAACSGVSALAEAAVLPHIGMSNALRQAYLTGPAHRLSQAAYFASQRALDRGEVWKSLEPIRAGHALLLQRIQVSGLQPAPEPIRSVARAILPGLCVGASPNTDLRWPAVEIHAPSATGSHPGGTA